MAEAGPAGDSTPQDVLWHEPIGRLLARYRTSPTGLSSTEAAQRLERAGPNVLRKRAEATLLRLIESRATQVLVIFGGRA